MSNDSGSKMSPPPLKYKGAESIIIEFLFSIVYYGLNALGLLSICYMRVALNVGRCCTIINNVTALYAIQSHDYHN